MRGTAGGIHPDGRVIIRCHARARTTRMDLGGRFWYVPQPSGGHFMAHVRKYVVILAGVLALALYGASPAAQAPKPAAQASTATAAQSGAKTAAARVTSPKEEWGHNIGDDYFLADYQQLI